MLPDFSENIYLGVFMKFYEIFILAVGLSMDAFAVSVCKGLAAPKARLANMAKCGLWFGGFQALMPLIGYFLASFFAAQIVAFDHWIAFVLLSLIGGNMLKEAFGDEDECNCNNGDFSVKTMFTMALATSVDALASGILIAMSEDGTGIWGAVALIGATTFVLSALGVRIGSLFGDKFGKKAQIAGGAILIFLGIKILIEHLLG